MSVAIGVNEMRPTGRRMRRPEHRWHLRTKPYLLQPFMVAPVLAGETLKNFLMQSRVVSDPIKNPLIGWHKEYYWFYCKLTDIDAYIGGTDLPTSVSVGTFVKMLLGDPAFVKTTTNNTTVAGGAVAPYYAVGEGQAYLNYAMATIVRHWFRDEVDASTSMMLDSRHLAMINQKTVLDSMILNDNYFQAQAATDVNVDLNANATITASEVDEALRRYQWARQNGLTDATYEDYLAEQGVNVSSPKPHRPELLRMVKQWSYPTNTVEPTTGVPSSALSWSFTERGDKDRFFKEPGFIIGVTTARPKVYLSNQQGGMFQWMDRAEDWLPQAMFGNDLASMKKFAQGTGPFNNISDLDGYWVDMRDLFVYGDQFINFTPATTDYGAVALPTATATKKVPSDSDITGLFKTPASAYYVKEDGVCQLAIAGVQRDRTATT